MFHCSNFRETFVSFAQNAAQCAIVARAVLAHTDVVGAVTKIVQRQWSRVCKMPSMQECLTFDRTRLLASIPIQEV